MTPARGDGDRRVVRRLESRGLPGLGAALLRLEGAELSGRYRLETLFAAGADGAIFLVRDLREATTRPRLVAKVPLLALHRPVSLESEGIRARRSAIREEGRLLSESASAFLPACLGVHEFTNPLLSPTRGGAFAEPEVALVMERLPGADLDAWLARVHRSRAGARLLRRTLDAVAAQLLSGLHDLEERGFFYADLRPGNVRIGGPDRGVRLLDAGSLVRRGDTSGRFPHVPAYLPAEVFRRTKRKGAAIRASSEIQAAMAGRALFEVATGRVPLPGEPVDASLLAKSRVSSHVAEAIEGLCEARFVTVRDALLHLRRGAPRGAWWRLNR